MQLVGFGLIAFLFVLVLMPVVLALLKGRVLAAIVAFVIMLASMSFGPIGYMLGFVIALIIVGISVSNHNQNRLISALSSTVGKNSRVELREHAVIGTPTRTREQTIDISPNPPTTSNKLRLEPVIQAPLIEYWACPDCRSPLADSSRYCSHCGTEVRWPVQR
jgi:hypothetical protein